MLNSRHFALVTGYFRLRTNTVATQSADILSQLSCNCRSAVSKPDNFTVSTQRHYKHRHERPQASCEDRATIPKTVQKQLYVQDQGRKHITTHAGNNSTLYISKVTIPT